MTSAPEQTPPSDPSGGDADAAGTTAPQTYTLRRAPRLSAVLALAAPLGLLAALVAATLAHSRPEPLTDPYSGAPLTLGSTFAFMAVPFLLAAVVLGLLVWLLLDRRSRAAARTVTLEPAGRPGAAPSGRTTRP